MEDLSCSVRLGKTVADFTLETYEPARFSFGGFSLETARKAGKWTVLFFYPADFTFV